MEVPRCIATMPPAHERLPRSLAHLDGGVGATLSLEDSELGEREFLGSDQAVLERFDEHLNRIDRRAELTAPDTGSLPDDLVARLVAAVSRAAQPLLPHACPRARSHGPDPVADPQRGLEHADAPEYHSESSSHAAPEPSTASIHATGDTTPHAARSSTTTPNRPEGSTRPTRGCRWAGVPIRRTGAERQLPPLEALAEIDRERLTGEQPVALLACRVPRDRVSRGKRAVRSDVVVPVPEFLHGLHDLDPVVITLAVRDLHDERWTVISEGLPCAEHDLGSRGPRAELHDMRNAPGALHV